MHALAELEGLKTEEEDRQVCGYGSVKDLETGTGLEYPSGL